MKAILMTATGNPDVLAYREIPEPRIESANQIKVKLAAAGVNPIDTKIRRNGIFYDRPLPTVLGCDGAGTVVETGNAVTRFKTGDKVWFCHGGLGREQGNYAEYNVLDERWALRMPDSLGFTDAAALPLVLITAWGGLFDRGGLQPGQTVLIHAGAGGVGHIAIQLAKHSNARVITTVSGQDKAELVEALGADAIIDYRRENIAEAVSRFTGGKGVDLVFDTVGPAAIAQSIPASAYFGRIVTLLGLHTIDLTEARTRNLTIGFELMLTPMLRDLDDIRDKHREILMRCTDWIDRGLVKPIVSRTFSLRECDQAHTIIEEGHTLGKLVLTMPSS